MKESRKSKPKSTKPALTPTEWRDDLTRFLIKAREDWSDGPPPCSLFFRSKKHSGQTGSIFFNMPDSAEERDQVAERIRALMKKEKAYQLIFFSEAWFVKGETPEDALVRPADHPNRTECMLIVHETEEGSETMILEMTRYDGGKVKLGEGIWETSKDMKGRFTRLLTSSTT